MSTTLRTRTTLPTHSTGWQALRIVTDRAGKWTKEEPRGRHRANTIEEFAKVFNQAMTRAVRL